LSRDRSYAEQDSAKVAAELGQSAQVIANRLQGVTGG